MSPEVAWWAQAVRDGTNLE